MHWTLLSSLSNILCIYSMQFLHVFHFQMFTNNLHSIFPLQTAAETTTEIYARAQKYEEEYQAVSNCNCFISLYTFDASSL